MKRLLLIGAVLLSACAPVAQLAQPQERATLTLDGQSLLLANPGPDALTGDPGRAGDGPALMVDGVGLTPDAAASAWCAANIERTRVACDLPTVPAGQRVRVTLVGTVGDAAVLAYRPSSGARPLLIWLK